MDFDVLFVGLAAGLGAITTAISPVLRRMIAETFKHPTERSEIVRDRETGELSAYVTTDEGARRSQHV